MAALFVSYRRDDTSGHAGRLYDRLAERFGSEQIFRDVDEISYGDDFVDTIDQAVGSCKALIAIIGPDWLNIQDRHGHRRLDNSNDFVRIELESALTRGDPDIPYSGPRRRDARCIRAAGKPLATLATPGAGDYRNPLRVRCRSTAGGLSEKGRYRSAASKKSREHPRDQYHKVSRARRVRSRWFRFTHTDRTRQTAWRRGT